MLKHIAIEEMLHMLLASDNLKAIGRSPKIFDASFVPNYLTHLPATVAGDLVVDLKPFSHGQVRDIFMRIEQPEFPIEFSVGDNQSFTPLFVSMKQR